MLRRALLASLLLISPVWGSIVFTLATNNVSASGTCVGSTPCAATKIVDRGLNYWSVTGGVVFIAPGGANNTTAGLSANVITLLYYTGTMYQENASAQWFSWTGTAWVSAPGDPRVSGSFGVKASGNKLVSTLNGASVTLIGGAMQGCSNGAVPAWCAATASLAPSFWSGSTWTSQHAGTNTVRLQLDICAYLNDTSFQPAATAAYATNVQQIVSSVTAAGEYIVISPAVSAPAGQQSPGQSGFLDATHGQPFWTAMANLYKNQPNVIFEIFNEPCGLCTRTSQTFNNWFPVSGDPYQSGNGTDTTVIAQGGSYTPFAFETTSGGSFTTVNVTYQVYGEIQALNLVRSLGATNLVLLSPTGFAGNIDTWPFSYQAGCAADPLHNCGASQHAYGYSFGAPPIQAVITDGFPVVETEFEVAVGSIGSASTVLGLGVSGLIACCPHDQGTPLVVFGPGSYTGSGTSTW